MKKVITNTPQHNRHGDDSTKTVPIGNTKIRKRKSFLNDIFLILVVISLVAFAVINLTLHAMLGGIHGSKKHGLRKDIIYKVFKKMNESQSQTTANGATTGLESKQNVPGTDTILAPAAPQERQDAKIDDKERKTHSPLEVTDPNKNDKTVDDSSRHKIAGLSCDKYGGPYGKVVDDMVYWSDIPSDSKYKSPFYDKGKYLTFEADHGGWNNIRMALETVVVLAIAMGRTLVLPPNHSMYLLDVKPRYQNVDFSFKDFYHLDSLKKEFPGLKIITMEKFLTKHAMKGKLKDLKTGGVIRPPDGRVDWNGEPQRPLHDYLRKVGKIPKWTNNCIVAFPATTAPDNLVKLQNIFDKVTSLDPPIQWQEYIGYPTPVNASFTERLKENLAGRNELCLYDEPLQRSPLVHFMVDDDVDTGVNMLIHFYSYVMFEDWRHDLWAKRFVRDRLRYIDELQCTAARVVEAVRARARAKDPVGNPDGAFDAVHVRRGDFQYKETRLEAAELYEASEENLKEGGPLYVATDERNKTFFKPMTDHYDAYFLDDFSDLFKDLNTNYYGMLDQMICTQSRAFYGTWFSTFSGFINRMRGYHVEKLKLEGYKDGTMKSWSFAPEEKVYEMREYYPVRKPFYIREFPTSWRDIDRGIDELWEKDTQII